MWNRKQAEIFVPAINAFYEKSKLTAPKYDDTWTVMGIATFLARKFKSVKKDKLDPKFHEEFNKLMNTALVCLKADEDFKAKKQAKLTVANVGSVAIEGDALLVAEQKLRLIEMEEMLEFKRLMALLQIGKLPFGPDQTRLSILIGRCGSSTSSST